MGITPAYAGKRLANIFQILLHRDHPRLCGEKIDFVQIVVCIEGSPPPMRGKVIGKHSAATTTQDHPRLCGEKFAVHLNCHFPKGSPPPMRGKGNKKEYLYHMFGITPAYAGKRAIPDDEKQDRRDHPRLCGEKQFCYFFVNSTPGSPPPMRGKAWNFHLTLWYQRITPAYAGKSLV